MSAVLCDEDFEYLPPQPISSASDDDIPEIAPWLVSMEVRAPDIIVCHIFYCNY